MPTVYHSKVDTWIAVVLIAAIGVVLFSAVRVLIRNGDTAVWSILVLLIGVGGGLPLWILCATHYTLSDGMLSVRSGPFRWHIPVAKITSITPTSNAASSPALSLDRLNIRYGDHRSIMVSPREKDAFLRDINTLRGSAE